ncbi:unnamed protein product [Rhizophagus irregularis]|nr:unnamed protein product [Rhizophagus irregularis]
MLDIYNNFYRMKNKGNEINNDKAKPLTKVVKFNLHIDARIEKRKIYDEQRNLREQEKIRKQKEEEANPIVMSEASTSATATGNETFTLADEIKKYKTHVLIEFLQKEEDLELDDDDLEIIRKEKVNGRDFLKLTEEKLERHGMKLGPASRLADFAKECKERKKRSFSSYKILKDLKEVLAKYGIDGNGIGAIRQFLPKTYTLEDDDEELIQCVREIKRRLGNMGTLLDSNEAMRCEYISAILHASLYIVKRITEKEITLAPQLELRSWKLYQVVMGFAQNLVQCESALQVNKKRKADTAFREDFDYIYGIVTTATDWYFILYASDGICCTSKNPLSIRFTESALKEGSEEEKELFRNVKRVIEVVVGLLKDRVDVEKEPVMKKQRVQEYFEKK